MKILCIGESILEVVSAIDGSIVEGQQVRLTENSVCGGGHAGNMACLLAKWGFETYIASMLGADDFGNKIKSDYETSGVKIDYLETSYDKPTGQNIVLLNKTTKNHTVLQLDSNSNLKKYSFTIEPNVIVADGEEYNATIHAMDKYSNALTFLKISRCSNEILELGKLAKYLIINKQSSEEITKINIDFQDSSTLVNVFNRLQQKFPTSEIIVTLGERGCLYTMNSQIKVMAPIRSEVVNTYGAGDIFAGAFVYGIVRELGFEKALTFANIASSFSVGKLTSRLSMPTLIEVSNYYDQTFGVQNGAGFENQNQSLGESNVVPATTQNEFIDISNGNVGAGEYYSNQEVVENINDNQ